MSCKLVNNANQDRSGGTGGVVIYMIYNIFSAGNISFYITLFIEIRKIIVDGMIGTDNDSAMVRIIVCLT